MGKTKDPLHFTKRSLEKLPTPAENRAVYHDSQVRGLGLLVQPTGYRAFFWFRKVDGRAKWITIGAFPDVTIEQARAKASEFNTSSSNWKLAGYDGPSPFKRRAGITLGQVFESYLELHRKENAKNPERSMREDSAQFKRHLSGFANRRLDSIRREDLRILHATIGKKHGHYSANRMIQMIRRIINWAIKEERWKGENPARGLTLFREESRERFLQPEELTRLFEELGREKNVDLRDFVYLALFTGARRGNIVAMRWEQLAETADGGRHWTIPSLKSRKAHTIPLVDEAVKLLAERRKFISGEWVFPSRGELGHVRDFKRGWKQLLKRAQLTELRMHDLRRTLGSWMASAGVSLPIIGKTLGHQSMQATQVYSRLQLDPVRDAIHLATSAMMAAGKRKSAELLKGAA